MLKNVILTGGTGLTGNALLRYLLKQNVSVTVLVRKNSIRLGNIPNHPNVKIVFCNLDEYSVADDLLKGVSYDAFFHLAWDGSMGDKKVDNRYNVSLQMSNLNYLLQAVELCNRIGCKKFIATGSQAEYGLVKDSINENTPCFPNTAYGAAKVCAHGMAEILCDKYGISLIWIRLFSIYGPHDGAQSLVDTAVKEMINKKKSIAYSSGEQEWNYLYSFDAAKAIYLLADRLNHSDTFCVASAKGRKLKEYINCIHETVDNKIVPRFGEKESGPVELNVDISKLEREIGAFEEYTFEEGIKTIVSEYKKNV